MPKQSDFKKGEVANYEDIEVVILDKSENSPEVYVAPLRGYWHKDSSKNTFMWVNPELLEKLSYYDQRQVNFELYYKSEQQHLIDIYVTLVDQAEEINELKDLVKTLIQEVAEIKSHFSPRRSYE